MNCRLVLYSVAMPIIVSALALAIVWPFVKYAVIPNIFKTVFVSNLSQQYTETLIIIVCNNKNLIQWTGPIL